MIMFNDNDKMSTYSSLLEKCSCVCVYVCVCVCLCVCVCVSIKTM